MSGLFPPAAPDMRQVLESLQREIRMRESVYPRWVANGKLTKDKADHELQCMAAALEILWRLANPPDDFLEHVARAHDQEESAQRGEPSPWTFKGADAGDDATFRSERLAAMREALKAAVTFDLAKWEAGA
jgi:hypothetical protein